MVEQTFLGNDQIMQRGWGGGGVGGVSFPDAFSNNLNINPNQSIELWKDLSSRFMVKRFQRSSQVRFPSC